MNVYRKISGREVRPLIFYRGHAPSEGVRAGHRKR